jgi:3-oxoacyl-[acyl-carrier-protein] synthase III
MIEQRNVMGAMPVLRALLDGDVGVRLVVGGDLLPAVVDDEEPRRRAALGQAAGAEVSGRSVGKESLTHKSRAEQSRILTSGGRA